jgi:hypothetical protein
VDLRLPGLITASGKVLRVVHVLQSFRQDVHATQVAGPV